jgi:hypothetical protein
LYVHEHYLCVLLYWKDSTKFFGELEVVHESVYIIIYVDGVVGIATRYELDRSGFDPLWRLENSATARLDRPCVPPCHYNGYCTLPEGTATGVHR